MTLVNLGVHRRLLYEKSMSFRDVAKWFSAELSELIARRVPPLDILIRDLERKASRRGRDDQFPICSGSPYNVRT
jgi:hypothetical protein